MPKEPTAAEVVFQHYLEALKNNNLEELMADYTEESEIWSPKGELVGLDMISAFFSYVFTLLPKVTTHFQLKYFVAKEDIIYILWDAESPFVSIPFASDCF